MALSSHFQLPKTLHSSKQFPFLRFASVKWRDTGSKRQKKRSNFRLHLLLLIEKMNQIKVARDEVKNASFAQRSAHRDSRIWRPELIEPAAERKQRARSDDGRSNRPTPTHRFRHSAIFHPITPKMFGFSESADIGPSF